MPKKLCLFNGKHVLFALIEERMNSVQLMSTKLEKDCFLTKLLGRYQICRPGYSTGKARFPYMLVSVYTPTTV